MLPLDGSFVKSQISSLSKAYIRSYQGLSKKCWQGIGLTFLCDTAGGVSFFMSLYFVKVLHLNVFMTGIIMSLYGLGTTLGGFIGGKLSDRFSPSLISFASLAIMSILFFLLVKIRTFGYIEVDLFILGLAFYGFVTSNNVWVLNQCKTSETERLKAINLITVASNLGLGLSAVIISFLVQDGFKFIFYLSGITLALMAIYLAVQEFGIQKKSSGTRADQVTESEEEPQGKSAPFVILIVLCCLFLVGLVVAQMRTTYPIYIDASFPQYHLKLVSFLFILNSALIVFLQTPVVNFFGKYNKVFMVGIGGLLFGFGMLMLNLKTATVVAIVSCITFTFGEMLFFSMAQLVIYQNSTLEKRGQNLGLFWGVNALSVIVGPSIGGFIYHHYQSSMIWYLSGLIGLICFFACFLYRKKISIV